jgi:GalNAc-alpha-(1->4)-GalNAc-alpha-(1->3)-diNAcBac-PP-undecaprenol alpha-1,4-N-acetyl-D-galactosaminyltransferase
MRLTLVISSLSAGGAERVMSAMANYWANRGHEIVLITIDDKETDFFEIDDRITRVPLGMLSPSASMRESVATNLRRVARLREEIKASQPEAVISFIEKMNILTLLATVGCPIPIIVSERTDPRRHYIGRFVRLLRILTYRKAAALVVQTPSVAEWARGLVAAKKIKVIANAVTSFVEPTHTGKCPPAVLAVGRLVPVKGFDLLIRAFARCAEAHPEWVLRIVGEGEARGDLEKLGQDLGLNGQLELPGRLNAVDAMRYGQIFVLSSRYEGFPNALLEAMASGLPVVSFDCPSGPGHIVRHGVDGLLIPPGDIDRLAIALDRLMANPDDRARLATSARAVKSRFAEPVVMARWEDLLASVTEGCQNANS